MHVRSHGVVECNMWHPLQIQTLWCGVTSPLTTTTTHLKTVGAAVPWLPPHDDGQAYKTWRLPHRTRTNTPCKRHRLLPHWSTTDPPALPRHAQETRGRVYNTPTATPPDHDGPHHDAGRAYEVPTATPPAQDCPPCVATSWPENEVTNVRGPTATPPDQDDPPCVAMSRPRRPRMSIRRPDRYTSGPGWPPRVATSPPRRPRMSIQGPDLYPGGPE